MPKKKAFGFIAPRKSSSENSEDEQINTKIFTKTEHGIVENGQLKRPLPLQIKGPLDKMFNNSVKYTETQKVVAVSDPMVKSADNKMAISNTDNVKKVQDSKTFLMLLKQVL